MGIEKKCLNCHEVKVLGEFFTADYDGLAKQIRSSRYCIACHEAGLIPYGYGWPGYGEKFKTPADTGVMR